MEKIEKLEENHRDDGSRSNNLNQSIQSRGSSFMKMRTPRGLDALKDSLRKKVEEMKVVTALKRKPSVVKYS